MEKLPEDFKQKLVTALRSGEYKQGRMVLYDPSSDAFCCLGVAGCIAGLKKEHMQNKSFVGSWLEVYLQPDEAVGYPVALQKNARESAASKLSQMNDQGKSFYEIADYIEKEL